MMGGQSRFRTVLAALTLAVAIASLANAEYFGKEVIAEIAVYAILAMSLDLVAGYSGMVSLGHGALFGVGAYMYAHLTVSAGLTSGAAVACASAITGIVALGVGAAVSRVHGIFFIMATLAIGEMGYEFFFKSKTFGGDDGYSGIPRPDLGFAGLDSADPTVFAAMAIAAAALVYLLIRWLMASPYGWALVGLHENEGRMRALGLPTRVYRTSVMGVSGLVAGFAGTLSAMHSQFITPSLLGWTNSGEVLIMVILGGLGTLIGAVIGTAAVVIFKRYDLCPILAPPLDQHGWCPNPDYWHFWLGVFLIAVVLWRANGVVGWLEAVWRRVAAPRGPSEHHSAGNGSGSGTDAAR